MELNDETYEVLLADWRRFDDWNNQKVIDQTDDPVNHPAHYTKGSQEAIVTIEEAIHDAPSVEAGFLQGQVLKYLLRVWHKDNPKQDASKAQWYLDRLIETLD